MYGDSITIGQGLIVTVFSMVIVFISLIIISYFIDGLKLFSSGKKEGKKDNAAKIEPVKDEVEQIKNENASSEAEDDMKLVAVIAAAIANSMGVDVSDVQIRSIRRVKQSSPACAKVGTEEQIFSRL